MAKIENHAKRHQVAYVIFDVDGTLVNNLGLIVKSFNFAVGDIMNRKFSRKEVYSRFGPTLEDMIEEAVSNKEAKDAIQRYHSFYKKCFHRYARIYPMINQLVSELGNACIPISICTGSDARMTKTTLEETGLRDEFSIVVTADEVHRPKPDPEGLIRATTLMRANPDQTIYVGDAVRDIEAARRAGIRSAAALWGFTKSDDLKAHHPDFAFNNPREALDYLVYARETASV
ncbi:MAG TPA: HAD-IA family hydrolase [Candidatus Bathyarchaeia archaeon]|nr:HAD-IA family hydrolase [Candidatus Bathyarchaeia archaeon]